MGVGGESTDDRAGEPPDCVRAGVAVHGAGNCPVVAASTGHDGPLTGVNWTHAGETHTEEFRASDPDAVDRAAGVPAAASVVDRGRLTGRQREVLRTAYRTGHFERPLTPPAVGSAPR